MKEVLALRRKASCGKSAGILRAAGRCRNGGCATGILLRLNVLVRRTLSSVLHRWLLRLAEFGDQETLPALPLQPSSG